MQLRKQFAYGFTLIELMVVVFVIGVLSGIAIPSYLTSRQHAQKDICRENRHTIDRWLQVYVQTEQRTPVDLQELIDGGYISPTRCPAGGKYELRLPADAPEETATYHPVPYVWCSVHGSDHAENAEDEDPPEIEIRPIEKALPVQPAVGDGLPLGKPLR